MGINPIKGGEAMEQKTQNMAPDFFEQEPQKEPKQEQVVEQGPQTIEASAKTPAEKEKKEKPKQKELQKEPKQETQKEPQKEEKPIVPMDRPTEPMAVIFELARELSRSGAVDALKDLFALRQQMVDEIARKEFYEALRLVQQELPPIERKRVVKNKDGTVRYKYASYEDIVKVAKPILTAHGFSFAFKSEVRDKVITIKCELYHESGHVESTEVSLPILDTGNMNQAQTIGALVTYAKRYSLSLLLGLATEEDVDANEDVEIKDNAIVLRQEQASSQPQTSKWETQQTTSRWEPMKNGNKTLTEANEKIEDEEYVERRRLRIEVAQLLKDHFPNKKTTEREEIWQNFLQTHYGVTTSKALDVKQLREAVETLKKELQQYGEILEF
jgi:hypothetical protein